MNRKISWLFVAFSVLVSAAALGSNVYASAPAAPTNITSAGTSTANKIDGHGAMNTTEVQNSGTGAFTWAHGTLQIGDKFYIGTRNTPGTIAVFTDPNNIQSYTSTTLTGHGGVETMAYDDVHNLIYAASTKTDGLEIISINPDNITDWHVVYSSTTILGGGAPAIVTDGAYVYGVTNAEQAQFFKIRISDWSLVAVNDWVGADAGHGGQLIKYADHTELYFSYVLHQLGTSDLDGGFAKVDPTDLSYTDIRQLGGQITDDMYCQKTSESGSYCYLQAEDSDVGFRINTASMSKTNFWTPKGYGVFSDGSTLYTLGLSGYIAEYPQFDITSPKVYALPGEVPNEFFHTSGGRKFFTNWANNGYLKEYTTGNTINALSTLSLSWQESTPDVFFKIQQSSDGIHYFSPVDYMRTNNYSATNLLPSTTYWFKILASSTDGISSSTSYSVQTPGFQAAPTAQISNLSASPVSDSQINLSWTGTGGEYQVAYRNVVSGWVTDTSYSAEGLGYAENYSFAVKARNADGLESSYATTSTSTISYPDIPTDVSVVAGDSQATIYFSSAHDGGSPITNYWIMSPDDENVWVDTTSSPAIIPNLINGQSYTFTVQAFNAFGSFGLSSPSAPIIPNPPVVSSGGGGGGGGSVITIAPITLLADKSADAPLFSILGGQNVSSPNLQIVFNANPDTVSGYAISLDPNFNNTSIIKYSSSTNFTIPDKPGKYQMYARLYSKSGSYLQGQAEVNYQARPSKDEPPANISAPSTKPLPVAKIDQKLTNKLKGKLLIQVENGGYVWYVSPKDGTRQPIEQSTDVLNTLKTQALGISNANLNKIPVAAASLTSLTQDSDHDGYPDNVELTNGYNPNGPGKLVINKNFAGQQKGKFFLQVQNRGELWYVNPADGKRYFLNSSADALSLIKKLGLGISNQNLAKIAIKK